MPPNVLNSWDSISAKRQLRGILAHKEDDDDHHQHDHPEIDADLFLAPKKASTNSEPTDTDRRGLWKRILENDVKVIHDDDDEEMSASSPSSLLASLSSIIVLSDETRQRDWLNRFGGRLSNVSSELLEGLR
jgi:hypothetical protein